MNQAQKKSLIKELIREQMHLENKRDLISKKIAELEKDLDKLLDRPTDPEVANEQKLLDKEPLQITASTSNLNHLENNSDTSEENKGK